MSATEFNRPLTQRDILPTIVGFFSGIGISACICTQNYPVGEFLFTFIFSYAIGVVFHEVGHAGAALALKGDVNYVRLGIRLSKRPPWNVRFWGLNWFIYGLPFSGCVQSSFYTTDSYRLRNFIFIAAGPLINAIFLTIGIALTYFASPPIQVELLVAWIFANGWLFVHSLTPNMVKSYGQLIPNDGLSLWRIIHQSDDEIRRIVESCVIARDFKLGNSAAEKMSKDELLAKHEADPGNVAFVWYLAENFRASDDPRYPEYLMKVIAVPRMPDTTIASLIDNCLTWQLHIGPPEKPEFADELSQRLLKIDDSISTRGTRGSVLVDIGRIEEGKTMLADVLAKTDSLIDKAYSHIFLALASKSEGNIDAAQDHAKAAKGFDPTCQALKRVADLLEPDQRRS